MQFFTNNPALRSQIESQVDLINEFSQKALEAMRQITEINLTLARQTAEASLYASREILSARDPAQLGQTVMKQMHPAAERLRNYQQHLMAVMAGAQAEFTHTAEKRIPEASRRANAAADEMVRHASIAANVPVTGPGGFTPNGPAAPSQGSGNGSVDGTQRSL
jgi:phasin family protein